MQAGAIAAPVQPAPKQSKPPPSPAEEPAKKKSGGVVKKPPAKPADAGDGGEGDPEPPPAEPVKMYIHVTDKASFHSPNIRAHTTPSPQHCHLCYVVLTIA